MSPPISTATPPQDGIPTINNPFVDDNRLITQAWFRLILSMWKKLGSGQSAVGSAYLVVNTVTGLVDVYSSVTNLKLGAIQYQPTAGGVPVPVPTAISPLVYTALALGNLLVSSGMVEISRVAGTFSQLSLVGGYFFLEPGDSLRISWYDVANPPKVIWFPYS